MKNPLKIIIVGASGKMGQTLIKEILNNPELSLIGAIDQATCPNLGMDAGALFGIKTDVIINNDFSSILAKAFALVREASVRTLGLRHFYEQLLGVISINIFVFIVPPLRYV